MKKSLLAFAIVGLVLITTGYWLFTSKEEFSFMDIFHLGVILLIVGFGFFVAFKKIGNAKRGEPIEDELSKTILQKSAPISFYISLYIWVFLIFLKERVNFETE